ncbi:MAG: repeat protein [Pedosphaera sp.]|nr:repeat protein [Pedosphaera sp.]
MTTDKTAPPFQGSIIGHGAYRYRVDKLWSQADPATTPVNNCHEMVQVSGGRLFMLTDEVRNNMLIYDKSGKLLDSWTLNLGGAHGLTLVKEGGREVFWIADFKGRVLKASLTGELLMELPTAEKCGAYEAGQKYSPTEVAVGPEGQIYVADGYGSQFILRFDSTGKYLGKFGGQSYLTQGKFLQAHGLVVDTREKEPLLLCTERMRNEFQWFTLAGEFVKSVYLPGAFMSRPVIHGDLLLSGVCFGMMPNDFRPKLNRGFVTILDKDNRAISNPGGQEPHYNDAGRLGVMMQDQPVFQHCHDVCVDDQEDIYVCQWNANNVYPAKLHRVG